MSVRKVSEICRAVVSMSLLVGPLCPVAIGAGSVDVPLRAVGQVVMYDSFFRGQTLAIQPSDESLSLGETTFAAAFCPVDSKHSCFDAQEFHFAVPKNYSCDDSKWVVNGQTYRRAVPLYSRQFLGRTLRVCTIESIGKTTGGATAKARYLFSPDQGLIAYEIDIGGPDGFRDLFVLREGEGFGRD